MTPEPQPTSEDPAMRAYEGGPLGAGIDWADPKSPLAPYYLTPAGVLAVAVLGLALCVLALRPLWHTDVWVHLKYGEWVVANRSLPEVEPLSPFTDKHAPMFNGWWLSQVGYRGLFCAGERLAGGDARRRFEGGVELIRLAHLAAAVVVVGFVGLACRRVSGSVHWAALGMLFLLIALLTPLSVQRPQLFALACFAALLCALSRGSLSRRAVVWIPFVMVLWVNLHGSFVVGFGLLGLFLLGRVIEVARADGGSLGVAGRNPAVRRLALTLGVTLLAVALLNPSGSSVYLDVIRLGGHPNLQSFAEWQPLDFSRPRGGHWMYLAVAVLLVATQVVSPRPFSPVQLLLIITLGVWPLLQQRAMVWWVMVAPWVVAPHWVAAAERWGLKLPASVPDFRRTALAILLVVLALFASPASAWVKTGHPRPMAFAVNRGTPYDVAAALKGEEPADADRVKGLVRAVREWYGGRYVGSVFASEIQGEYLLWSLPAESPVMLFNHAHLFTPRYWSECMRVKSAAPGWREFLDRHRVGVVVVECDSHQELCGELRVHSGWAVVIDEAKSPARDQYSRLFVAVRKPVPPTPLTPVAPQPHEPRGTP